MVAVIRRAATWPHQTPRDGEIIQETVTADHLRALFVDDWAWGMSSKGEHLICLMYEVQHKILNHNGPFDHCIASKG